MKSLILFTALFAACFTAQAQTTIYRLDSNDLAQESFWRANNDSNTQVMMTAFNASAITLSSAKIAASGASVFQPLDSDLTSIAALSTTSFGRSFLVLSNAAAGRTQLGLGTLATQSATISDYLTTAAAAAAYQPLDSDLTSVAGLSTTSFGRSFLILSDAEAGRAQLGLGTLATQSATITDYLTIASAADAYQPLDSDLTGVAALSTTSFGRSFLVLTNAAAARTQLALGTLATQDGTITDYLTTSSAASIYLTTSAAATTYQPLDSDLTSIAALSTTSFGRSFLALANDVAIRAQLGLGTLATQNGTISDYLTIASAASTYLTTSNAASTYQPLDSDLTSVAALSTTSFGRSFLTLTNDDQLRDLLDFGTAAGADLNTQAATAAPDNSSVAIYNSSGELGAQMFRAQTSGFITTETTSSDRIHITSDYIEMIKRPTGMDPESYTTITTEAFVLGSNVTQKGIEIISDRINFNSVFTAGQPPVDTAIQSFLSGTQATFIGADNIGAATYGFDGLSINNPLNPAESVTLSFSGLMFGALGTGIAPDNVDSSSLQIGLDAVNQTPVSRTLKASDGITGTDVSGGALTIASGDSTGTGTSTVTISTPAAGATGTTARIAARRATFTSTGVSFVGTTTNNNATAGDVGEVVSSLVASGSAVSLTTATSANVTSVSLTAGDWDIAGNVNFVEGSATVTARSAGINPTSATVPSDGSECYLGTLTTVMSGNNTIAVPMGRISLASTTTIYLVGRATFSAGTVGAYGKLFARRAR